MRDAGALLDRHHPRHGRPDAGVQLGAQLGEVLAHAESAAAFVLHRERHAQVRGHLVELEDLRRHDHTRRIGEGTAQHREERLLGRGEREAPPRLGGRLADRVQLLAVDLRQRLHQRGHELLAHAGHLPVEAVHAHTVEHGERHVHQHAVVDGAGIEAVGDVEREIVLGPRAGEVAWVEHRLRRAPQRGQLLDREGEQLGVGPAGVLPPLVELSARRDRGRQQPVVEREHDRVVGEVDPADPLAQVAQAVDEGPVGGEERVWRLPVALHERMADEQLAGHRRVEPVEADRPTAHDREAEQRGALGDHGRPATGLPARVVVRPLHEMPAEALGPLGLDRGDGAGPQPVRLHQFGGHHPARQLLGDRRLAGDRELRPVRAAVLAGVATVLSAAGHRFGGRPAALATGRVAHPDLRQQARQQRLVHPVGVAGLVAVAHADLTRHLAQLAVQVLPLAHAEVVEVLGPAELAELARAELLLTLAQVVPQPHVGEEVGSVDGEPAVQFVGRLAMFRRSLAGILDRQRGRDHEHLADTAVALRLDDHAAEAGVDRQPRQPRAQRGETPVRLAVDRVGDRAQLLQQCEPVADRPRVGRVEEREGGHVAQAERRHLQDDRCEVGAQDLGLGELRAAERGRPR